MKISLNPQKILFLTAGLLILSAIAFVALRSGPLAPVMVTVEKVKEGNFHAELFGIGTVEARRSWMIGPTAAGRVLRQSRCGRARYKGAALSGNGPR